jgi:hypothetical protein
MATALPMPAKAERQRRHIRTRRSRLAGIRLAQPVPALPRLDGLEHSATQRNNCKRLADDQRRLWDAMQTLQQHEYERKGGW